MLEQKYKLSITGQGLNYEGEIEAYKATQILHICLSDNTGHSEMGKHGELDNKNSCSKNQMSVAEYYNQFDPKRNPDKILCFASFVIKILGRDSFEPTELKIYFQKCGEAIPKNYGRDFRWAVANGWFNESIEEQGFFYITSSGYNALDSNFEPELAKKTKFKRSVKKKNKDIAGTEVEKQG